MSFWHRSTDGSLRQSAASLVIALVLAMATIERRPLLREPIPVVQAVDRQQPMRPPTVRFDPRWN